MMGFRINRESALETYTDTGAFAELPHMGVSFTGVGLRASLFLISTNAHRESTLTSYCGKYDLHGTITNGVNAAKNA